MIRIIGLTVKSPVELLGSMGSTVWGLWGSMGSCLFSFFLLTASQYFCWCTQNKRRCKQNLLLLLLPVQQLTIMIITRGRKPQLY